MGLSYLPTGISSTPMAMALKGLTGLTLQQYCICSRRNSVQERDVHAASHLS